jgi:hypothetical protein
MKHTPITIDETTDLFVDLDKPSLRGLAWRLRRPKLWPEGFKWGYGSCSTCAIALAEKIWGKAALTMILSAPGVDRRRIFAGAQRVRHLVSMSSVTPDMIADDIEAYLAGHSAKES